jgi:PII-like signaling protein
METAMKLEGEGKLLRIFVGESDRYMKKPVYQVVVEEARKSGMAGATVIRGVESYGAASRIHTARLLELSEDLPMVVEIVDTPERIDGFLSTVEGIFEKAGCGGMITEEKVTVIRYTHGTKS